MVKSMDKDNGRCAVVLPQGILFREGQEQTLRQKLDEYFHTYDTVKIKDYATSTETFFLAKQGLCLKATWSWFTFLFSGWYLFTKRVFKGDCYFYIKSYSFYLV